MHLDDVTLGGLSRRGDGGRGRFEYATAHIKVNECAWTWGRACRRCVNDERSPRNAALQDDGGRAAPITVAVTVNEQVPRARHHLDVVFVSDASCSRVVQTVW